MRYGLGVGSDQIVLLVTEVDVARLERCENGFDKLPCRVRPPMLNNALQEITLLDLRDPKACEGDLRAVALPARSLGHAANAPR